jgi:hypothetical protein
MNGCCRGVEKRGEEVRREIRKGRTGVERKGSKGKKERRVEGN